MLHQSALILALAATGYSLPANGRRNDHRGAVCKDMMLSITATANNTVLPPYPNSTDPGVVYQYLGSFNSSTLPSRTVSGTFDISVTYCEPSVKVEGREGTIQLLLHGLSATKVSLENEALGCAYVLTNSDRNTGAGWITLHQTSPESTLGSPTPSLEDTLPSLWTTSGTETPRILIL